MLIVRLKPQGKKHNRQYRIVVADKSRHVSKKIIDSIGHYDPNSKIFKVNQEKLSKLVANNVEMSDRVKLVFKQNNVVL